LEQLRRASGGEAVAALAALERLLPRDRSLADILYIGLHYARQDRVDPSVVMDNRRLAADNDRLLRERDALADRLRSMQSVIASALAELHMVRSTIQSPLAKANRVAAGSRASRDGNAR
jgi:hypothetical protein